MSRVAKKPIEIPKGVEIKINEAEGTISAKGPMGTRTIALSALVKVVAEEQLLKVSPANEEDPAWSMAGTSRANIQNLVTGVAVGFKKELELRGVGYKARIDGKKLILSLGFSHEIIHEIVDGIKVEIPSQTSIVLTSSNLELLGQQAANIRGYRPPENYKGKGVRYLGEHVLIKETTKKK